MYRESRCRNARVPVSEASARTRTSSKLAASPSPRTPRAAVLAFAAAVAAAPPCAAAQAEDDEFVEEVVVTATKREESVQDVPIAVTALAGEDLLARGVQDLYGLQEVAPSLAVYSSNSTSNGGTLRIRGVGTTGNNPGLEAAVGTFIDGVYRSRAGLAFNDLDDIDRVEILRGPQGTLFGKNTVAGAINVVTRRPVFENSLAAKLGVGNLGGREAGLVANAVLVEDVLAGRLTLAHRERDGYYENVDSDAAYDNRDRYGVRGQLLWHPSDALEVRIIADFGEKDETCCPAAFWIPGPTSAVVALLGGDVAPFEVDGDLKVGLNYEPYERVEDRGISVDALFESDAGISFRYIGAVRDYAVARGQDIDFTGADILHPQDTDESFDNVSHEVHMFGANDDLSWLVGAYLYAEELASDEYIVLSHDGGRYIGALVGVPAIAPLFMGDPAGRGVPGQGYDAAFFTDTSGWALFTHNVWQVRPDFDVTLGLRYSSEDKEGGAIINGAPFGEVVNDPFCAVFGANPAFFSLCDNQSFRNEAGESTATGTVKGAWRLSEAAMAYASFGRGYKAGGFNLDQEAVGFRDPSGGFVDQSRFDAETSDSFELGLKVRAAGGRVTVNSALFHTTFHDFQLNTFTGLGFSVGNVSEATARGVEVESTIALGGGLFADLGVTYADARYGDDLAAANAHLAGRRLTQSPLWQSSASLFRAGPLGDTGWRWLAAVNWLHIGEVNTGSDLDPEKVRGALNVFNARLGTESGDGRFRIAAWARNLGSVQTNALVFDSVFQSGSWHTFSNPPRTLGLTLRLTL